MAKAKYTTHTQAIYISAKTGRFVSAAYAKRYPKTTIKRKVTIKRKK